MDQYASNFRSKESLCMIKLKDNILIEYKKIISLIKMCMPMYEMPGIARRTHIYLLFSRLTMDRGKEMHHP
jgi:hypothetical protein